MFTDLFVYGTLMYPELYRKITGEEPDYIPAELRHYSVRRLNERSYPGLIKRIGGRSIGLLVRNVSEQAMELLHEYEGEEYKVVEVSVTCEGQRVKAKTYAVKRDFMYLAMTEGWQPDWSKL